MGELCVVCRRRPPGTGAVCDGDRVRIREQLHDLVRKVDALATALVPSPSVGSGDRVSTSRTGAPVPVRMDVLSLRGGGNEQVTAILHPLVRHWSTTRTALVEIVVAGKPVVTERVIVDWHHEIARHPDGRPVMVGVDGRPHNDQIGVLPPVEWLDGWVRAWRSHFGHAAGTRTHRRNPGPRRALSRGDVDLVLGLNTHHRPGDPLADEWEVRFGDAPRDHAVAEHVTYLTTWLDAACDDDVGIAAFAGELRTLTAELTRVLGETPDQQWLGRCPATVTVTDDAADGTRPCGAGLWQDPHASQVLCPRCHSTWGPRQVELLHLAAQIRTVWPVDRRRRYTLDEIDALPDLGCPTCERPVIVRWREVTATVDTHRWWRPVGVVCPFGCPDAERLI